MRYPNPRPAPRVFSFPEDAEHACATRRFSAMRGKKFAQFCANGLVRRAKAMSIAWRRTRPGGFVHALPRVPPAVLDAMRCVRSRMSVIEESAFFPTFLRVLSRMRMPARMQRGSCASCRGTVRRHRRASAAKNICDRLLTVGKTVIRFRPSRRSLQKRVIKQNAITGRITCTSTNSKRWTPASHPSRKEEVPMLETCSAGRRGFFVGYRTSTVALRWIAGRQPIRPVRLARRRSIAGPIPVVSFETGLYRYTH